MRERLSGRAPELSDFWAVIALAALATTVMLEASRVFVSYLIFVVDQNQRLEIAVIVLAVFLAPALTPLLVRVTGLHRSILAAAIALAGLRVAVQFVDLPLLRLACGGAAIALWGALMIGLLASRRAQAGYGLILGLGLDVTIRIAFADVDLPWLPGIATNLVTVLLVGAIVAIALTLPPLMTSGATRRLASLPILVIGPALALQHLAIGNVGIAQVRTGLDYPDAAFAITLGAYAGAVLLFLKLFGPLRTTTGRTTIAWWITSAALSGVTLGIWLNASADGSRVGALLAITVAVGATSTLLGLALAAEPEPRADGVGPVTLWFTSGLIVQFAILFIYYSQTGRLALIAVAWAIAASCGALAVWAAAPTALQKLPSGFRLAAPAWGVVILLPSLLWISIWTVPANGPPASATFTVMTYNLQSGFSSDKEWDIEAQARVIETYDPDVVVLQEISRGWLVTTGSDQLLWLSRRLDMPYVWGPASDDGLWGNAILSRAPLSEVAELRYDSTQNFKRSAVRARVETESGPLWIIGTHLDNPAGAGAVRFEQVEQLLAFWNGRQPAVMLGDFNAVPADDVIMRVVASGFVDVGAALIPEATTSRDGRRIDYIFVTGDIAIDDALVPNTDASDHRPVVVTLTLDP